MPIRPAKRHSLRMGRRSAAIEWPMSAHVADAGVVDRRNRRASVVPRRRRRTVRSLEDSCSVHLSVLNGNAAAPGPLRLACVFAVVPAVLDATAEFQIGEETLRLRPARIAAIAAPGRELLDRLIEASAGGIDPGQAFARLEGRDVGQSAVLVALQPYAAAAVHLRYLVERKEYHLAVLADRSHQLALDRRDGARFVGRLDVEHLLALAGIAQAFVLGHDESPARFARDQKLAAALIAEHRYDVGFLLKIAEQPDRLPQAAPARQFRRFDRVAAAVGGEDQEL